MQALGPIAAGLLVSSTSPTIVFALDATTFVAAALALLAAGRNAKQPAGARPAENERPGLADTSGLRLIASATRLRFVLLVTAVSNVSVVGTSSILVVLPVGDTSSTDTSWTGLAFAGKAVGGFGGALLTRRTKGDRQALRWLAFRMALTCGPFSLLLT